jgi:hypothetical protein
VPFTETTSGVDLWVSIPTWPSGVYLTNPGTTGGGFNNPPTGNPTVNPNPQPFGTNTNYLRSKFTDVVAGDVCLKTVNGNYGILGAGTPVGPCTTAGGPDLNLTFNQYFPDQFKISPLGDPATCLQISDRDHAVWDAVAGRPALITQWGRCDNPFTTRAGHNNFMDELFTFTHVGSGFYNIKPANNYPNWPDPCLSIYAADGNNGLTGNVIGSGKPPVVQFNCSAGNPAWQQWAPVETNGYTNPQSCTTNCPPAPTGAHTFQHGIATPLERKTDLACINVGSQIAISEEFSDCAYFVPELVSFGWLLHDETDSTRCLGPIKGSLLVGFTSCSTSAIWNDQPIQVDGLTFPLVNVATNLCLGGVTQPVLEYCRLDSNQLWYDGNGEYLRCEEYTAATKRKMTVRGVYFENSPGQASRVTAYLHCGNEVGGFVFGLRHIYQGLHWGGRIGKWPKFAIRSTLMGPDVYEPQPNGNIRYQKKIFQFDQCGQSGPIPFPCPTPSFVQLVTVILRPDAFYGETTLGYTIINAYGSPETGYKT